MQAAVGLPHRTLGEGDRLLLGGATLRVLVTGGCGFIGSHTVVQLLAAGMQPVLLDNFVNSKPSVMDRLEQITGVRPPLVVADVRDRDALDAAFAEHPVDAVVHFAGLKAVGESVAKPLEYYDVNVHGSLVLVAAMQSAGVRSLVFSSSATVYGDPASVPITEDFPTSATNPYGRSKLMVEQILTDYAAANHGWSATLLRYFNPVGAHPSGLIGEDPQGIPNNLTPFISQVAVGRRERLQVFGDDYPTRDGTGVRDYIHVVDLADGHVAALQRATGRPGCRTWNLGTGRGTSVLEMVAAFRAASGCEVPYEVVARRPGDIAECWADTGKAERELGWRAERTVADMAADAWRWQQGNPSGFPD
jgi:UDP-glucose 4-epimerase